MLLESRQNVIKMPYLSFLSRINNTGDFDVALVDLIHDLASTGFSGGVILLLRVL